MKTSNIKPTFSAEQARELPVVADDFAEGTFQQLTEGHFSQAFSYETQSGEKRVLRLGRKLHSFQADKYTYEHFNAPGLPIPKVLEIGDVEPGLYYCISEFAPGVPSDQLPIEEFNAARAAIEESFARVFRTDISDSVGFGDIDFSTGNGKRTDYKPEAYMTDENLAQLREQCVQKEIKPGLVDVFARNFAANFPKIEFERRLTHGDLGFDNVLIEGNQVTAVIDWSSVGYGDWLHDYSRLEFWYPGRHTPATEFARRHGLDTQTFHERWLAHMADHALSTLGYVFKYEDEGTAQWVRHNLEGKLDLASLAGVE